MAMIPSKDKTKSFSTDNFDFTTMTLLCLTIMIGSHVVSNFVHEKFEIAGIVVVLLLVVYMLFPSSVNYGKNGIQRIFICMKFYGRKLRQWVN